MFPTSLQVSLIFFSYKRAQSSAEFEKLYKQRKNKNKNPSIIENDVTFRKRIV